MERFTMGKLALLITSGNFEKLNTAALLASGAIANEHKVLVFFMNDSVWSIQKGVYERNRAMYSIFPDVIRKVEAADKSGKLQVWYKLFPELKELGEIKIIACGLMTDIFGLEKKDLVDFVDDIAGVAYFTAEAMESDQVMTI